MRYAFLTTSCDLFIERMKPVADILKSQGHSIKVFAFLFQAKDVGHPLHMGDWTAFDIQTIINFDPNLVIVWNGHFPGMNAVVHYLRRDFRVAVTETGWFPQKKYSYLSHDLAQISDIVAEPYKEGVASREHNRTLLERVRSCYDLKLPSDLDLPEKFILVPRQLELDTQILITSEAFKTMGSLLGYVRHTFPQCEIVVTNHPLDKNQKNPSYAIDMTGKASSISIAQRAERVVGINSTTLAETMLFRIPTHCLGDHVARRALAFEKDLPANWEDHYDFRSLVLIYNQWDYTNPPGWLIDKLNNLDLTPRPVA